MPKKAAFDYDYTIKLLVLGDVGVGKTSLLLSWTTPDWKPSKSASLPPGEDEKSHLVCERGKRLMLKIFDTAGQESHKALTSTFYRGTQAIILVYDVTNEESFYSIKTWITEANRYCTDVSYILVGNKSDLPAPRKVPPEWGADLAKAHMMPFIETCAHDSHSVEQMSGLAVNTILDACAKPTSGVSGASGSNPELIRLDEAHTRKCC
ncbi:Ras family protein [Pelomyxa schiedti]|nr:Ras family protein [Pelomyxa schiedti]